ncbi:PH domain-containing protein [Clostridium sp.]|uniref:PH domain-containing protein n=1 Tax=Clostridium sp. TaxID=1506 RepID=UPI0026DCF3A8|nr:PH domain-containing protein [Clostridium sp.]MDO5038909.1 PH domain-containing protein [Clostridium sp.]
MGLLGGILGNASEISRESVIKDFGKLFWNGETVQKAYKLIRDTLIFTDKRLIMIDVQGATGKKIEYHSIPYKSITHFSVESSGHFDLDSELKIWISGIAEPIEKQFSKGVNIYEIQALLAEVVCR